MPDSQEVFKVSDFADQLYGMASDPKRVDPGTAAVRKTILDLDAKFPKGIPDVELVRALQTSAPNLMAGRSFSDMPTPTPPAGKDEGGFWSAIGAPLAEGVRPFVEKAAEYIGPHSRLYIGDVDPKERQQYEQFDTGFIKGMGGAAIDMTSPTNLGLMALNILTPAGWAKKGGAVARLAKSAIKHGFTAKMLTDSAKELPEAYDAYLNGDYENAGRMMAQGLVSLGFGIEGAKAKGGLGDKVASAGKEAKRIGVAWRNRANYPYAEPAAPGGAPLPEGVFPSARPRPPSPGMELDVVRGNRGAPIQVATPSAAMSPARAELNRLISLPSEKLAAERSAAAARVQKLESAAPSMSQGIDVGKGKRVTGGGPILPEDFRRNLAQARAKVDLIDRAKLIQSRFGATAQPPATAEVSGFGQQNTQGPPPLAGEALPTPQTIAAKHGLDVAGPGRGDIFNLNKIWQDPIGSSVNPEIGSIRYRLQELANARAKMPAGSPQALEAERRIAALQDMIKAKAYASVPGTPLPPEVPQYTGPVSTETAPAGQSPLPPVPFDRKTVLEPPEFMRVPQERRLPEAPIAQQYPHGWTDQPMVYGEVEIAKGHQPIPRIAERYGLPAQELESAASLSDQELVGLVNRLTEMRAAVTTGRGGATVLPGAPPISGILSRAAPAAASLPGQPPMAAADARAMRAERLTSQINAYTEILLGRRGPTSIPVSQQTIEPTFTVVEPGATPLPAAAEVVNPPAAVKPKARKQKPVTAATKPIQLTTTKAGPPRSIPSLAEIIKARKTAAPPEPTPIAGPGKLTPNSEFIYIDGRGNPIEVKFTTMSGPNRAIVVTNEGQLLAVEPRFLKPK